ncbi:unnamed protein product, partial [Ectocarpus fasciculatus]
MLAATEKGTEWWLENVRHDLSKGKEGEKVQRRYLETFPIINETINPTQRPKRRVGKNKDLADMTLLQKEYHECVVRAARDGGSLKDITRIVGKAVPVALAHTGTG